MSKHTLYRVLVFLTATLQLVYPILFPLDFQRTDWTLEPRIVPAGYTFAIWGIITTLSFLYGLWQLTGKSKNQALLDRISLPIIGVYSGYSSWLYAAERDWLIPTLIIFIGMFYLLKTSFEQVLPRMTKLALSERIILGGQLAIYIGWSSVAIFANLAACIVHYGVSAEGHWGLLWQSLILILALVNAVYWIIRFRLDYTYIATITWAFVGIFFGTIRYEDTLVLQIITLLAILTLVLIVILKKKIYTRAYHSLVE